MASGTTALAIRPARRRVVTSTRLLRDVRKLIVSARERTAQTVNAGLVAMYWGIGARILREVLKSRRAEYGEEIVATLSRQLVTEFGDGFSRSNLFRMVRLAEAFPDIKIVATLSRQLGWSHFVEIIQHKDELRRDFYAEMCRVERWSVRTLREKIGSMLFERTALSKKPAKMAKQELKALREEDKLTPDLVFRDPYVLDFLKLQDTYSEKDLESAILKEIERFLVEMGGGFTFVARQKRITLDGTDYYLDLLFFHRRLRRLVALELKLGKFQAGDMGQMELYLRWLDRHERMPEEEAPVGVILCAEKATEHVELLQLEGRGIRVAEYLTDIPQRSVLRKKLRQALELAREQLAQRQRERKTLAREEASGL
ncbi:MAG TPA: PDDEXK nuclease domain-containing protein [Planctomycetota bacterium]|jgi:predicted nuclease of restriction endonuclease-like (RecB) superfamily